MARKGSKTLVVPHLSLLVPLLHFNETRFPSCRVQRSRLHNIGKGKFGERSLPMRSLEPYPCTIKTCIDRGSEVVQWLEPMTAQA